MDPIPLRQLESVERCNMLRIRCARPVRSILGVGCEDKMIDFDLPHIIVEERLVDLPPCGRDYKRGVGLIVGFSSGLDCCSDVENRVLSHPQPNQMFEAEPLGNDTIINIFLQPVCAN